MLQQAAEAGIDAFRRNGATALAAGPLDAAQTALTRESKRLHQSRPAVCTQLIKVLELEELEDDRLVTDAHLGQIGVAAAERKSGSADQIFILVVVESATCE